MLLCIVKQNCCNTRFMHTQDLHFRKMLTDTIFDGLEKQLELKIDRERVIYLHMPYKGIPATSVIRKKINDEQEEVRILKITLWMIIIMPLCRCLMGVH